MSGALERVKAFCAAWQSAMDDDLTSDVIAVIDGKSLRKSDLRALVAEVEQLRARTREEIERRSYAVTHAKVCEEKCDKALAEVERLRAEREALAALADELQDAELCDKVARSEWLHDRISRHETLGPAGRLADERLNETQARLCAAQDAWAAAAMQYRTARASAAPQLPERSPCCGGAHAGWIHAADCGNPEQPDRVALCGFPYPTTKDET